MQKQLEQDIAETHSTSTSDAEKDEACKDNGGSATKDRKDDEMNADDAEVDNDKQTGETAMKEFDWKNWQEPENINLHSAIQTFWESIKDSLLEYGAILRLDDIIVSPFSVVLSINCNDHNATIGRPQLLYQLKDALDSFDGHPYVIDSLPETCNIGIGFRRSYDDDEVPSLTEMVNSPAYKKLEKDPNAVPIVLGIDHMNKPLVVNLADYNNLVITVCDAMDLDYNFETIVSGIMYGRSPYDVQLTILNGCHGGYLPTIKNSCEYPYSKNSLPHSPSEKNVMNWCNHAITILEEVERDCVMRRKIIRAANCDYDYIAEYNKVTGKNMTHRVIMLIDIPDFYNCSSETKSAIDKLNEKIRNFIEISKADVGVHFVLWKFPTSELDADDGNSLFLINTLLMNRNLTHFVAYTRFDELGTLLNFAGGKEACDSNNLGPLVYRSPEGEIHYFQFAKVKDDERNLAIDKWGLTRTTVNDNIPDDEGVENERETTEGDDDLELNFGHEEETVDVIAEPAGE